MMVSHGKYGKSLARSWEAPCPGSLISKPLHSVSSQNCFPLLWKKSSTSGRYEEAVVARWGAMSTVGRREGLELGARV